MIPILLASLALWHAQQPRWVSTDPIVFVTTERIVVAHGGGMIGNMPCDSIDVYCTCYSLHGRKATSCCGSNGYIDASRYIGGQMHIASVGDRYGKIDTFHGSVVIR